MGFLQGRTAVVTGGSRGIGRAIVRRLTAEGAAVVSGYTTGEEQARHLLEEVEGRQAWAVRADLAKPEEVGELFATADHHLGSRLDILVNNAGVTRRVAVSEATVEDFDQVMAINARGALLAMQHASARMAEGARMVNVSSVSTAWPAADEALYAASKGALEQLSRVASREFGPRGITVNTVSPGTTDTEFLRAHVPPEAREAVAGMTPLRRLGEPDDIAEIVAYLAGPHSGWITGQNIRADGGLV